MSVVRSCLQVMQQTFGTTVSTADSVSAVRNEAPYECHEQRANFDAHLSHSCVFVYSRLMIRPVLSSIVIRATTFSHDVTWCDRFSLSCRNESRFEYAQADSTVSTNRPLLWMCDRGHIQTVLTWLHTQLEDGMKVTHANAFLSPVPVSSRAGFTRFWVLSRIHCLSASFLKHDVLSEGLHKEGNVSRCDCKHDCSDSR